MDIYPFANDIIVTKRHVPSCSHSRWEWWSLRRLEQRRRSSPCPHRNLKICQTKKTNWSATCRTKSCIPRVFKTTSHVSLYYYESLNASLRVYTQSLSLFIIVSLLYCILVNEVKSRVETSCCRGSGRWHGRPECHQRRHQLQYYKQFLRVEPEFRKIEHRSIANPSSI